MCWEMLERTPGLEMTPTAEKNRKEKGSATKATEAECTVDRNCRGPYTRMGLVKQQKNDNQQQKSAALVGKRVNGYVAS